MVMTVQNTPVRMMSTNISSTPDLTKTVTKNSPSKLELSQIPENSISYDSNGEIIQEKPKPNSDPCRLMTPCKITKSYPKNIESGNIYENYLSKLSSNFGKSLKELSKDPLMSVFREKEATHEFMFQRLQEVLTECIKQSNNDYLQKLMAQMQKLNDKISTLQQKKRKILDENVNLKNQQESEKRRYEELIELKVKSFSDEIESYRDMVNLVEESRKKLEKEVSKLKNELSDIQEESKKSESLAVGVIKENTEKIEQLESQIVEKEHQIGSLNESIEAHNSKIMELEQMLFEKEAEMMQAQEKLSQMEQDQKQSEELSSQLAAELNTKLEESKNELDQMKDKYNQLEGILNQDDKYKEIMTRMSNLEMEISQKSDELDVYALNLEESEFNKGQLEVTVAELKKEMTEMSQKLIEQRQNNHSNDLLVISLKDKSSELTILNSDLTEEITKLKQENSFLKKANEDVEANLKQSRRDAATLERELDQVKFSNSTVFRENNEMIVSFKNQIDHLKVENEKLNERLQKSLKEHNAKLEIERCSHMKSKEKVRVLEALEERMQIEIENLSKKVQFFKASTLKATHASESQVASHCSLIETSQVKAQLRDLMKEVIKYKEVHKKEKELIKEQVGFFYSNIRSIVEIMSVRIREEGKKNFYLVNDVTRLNRDLEHLKKVNDDFSVRLKESRSLSKMTSLRNTYDLTNFESHNISDTHLTQNTDFLIGAHISQQNAEGTQDPSMMNHQRSALTQTKPNRMERMEDQRQYRSRSPYQNKQKQNFNKNICDQHSTPLAQSQYLAKYEEPGMRSPAPRSQRVAQNDYLNFNQAQQMRSRERDTSQEKYRRKLQELSKPMPKPLFKRKSVNTHMQSQNSIMQNIDGDNINQLRTRSHNLEAHQMQSLVKQRYMTNVPNLNDEQRRKKLEEESRVIDSKLAMLRKQQQNNSNFMTPYREDKENFSLQNNHNSNMFINNLNLKMLSIHSNQHQINPQRSKLQNQASVNSLTDCSYNQKHFSNLGKLTEKLNNFDPTIRSKGSQMNYSPYRNQHNYGYAPQGNNFWSDHKKNHEEFYSENTQISRNVSQNMNFNATYQPDRFNYTEDMGQYETPQQLQTIDNPPYMTNMQVRGQAEYNSESGELVPINEVRSKVETSFD